MRTMRHMEVDGDGVAITTTVSQWITIRHEREAQALLGALWKENCQSVHFDLGPSGHVTLVTRHVLERGRTAAAEEDRIRALVQDTLSQVAQPATDPLHLVGRCTCCGEGRCEWCNRPAVQEDQLRPAYNNEERQCKR